MRDLRTILFLPGWLRYSAVLVVLGIAPFWMIHSGGADPFWRYVLFFVPLPAALLSGILPLGRLAHVLCWAGEARYWLAAAALPLMVEFLTVTAAVFLRIGEFAPTPVAITSGDFFDRACRLAPEMMNGDTPEGLFLLLASGGLAAVIYLPFAAAGELGWRAALHLHSTGKFGFVKGAALTGIIWGAWQAAAVLADSSAAQIPAVMLIAKTVVTALVLSIVLGYFFEQSGSIWVTALLLASANSVHGIQWLAVTHQNGDLLIWILRIGLWVIVAEICLGLWSKSNK